MKFGSPPNWLRFGKTPNVLMASSVFLAGIFLGELNLLSAHSYKRFDATSDARFTLEPNTKTALHASNEPLEVVVLVSPSQPLFPEIGVVLESFRAERSSLRLRYVDPEREPAAYLQEASGDSAGSGSLLAAPGLGASENLALLLKQGGRRASVTTQELQTTDAHRSKRIEAAITRALGEVSESESARLCLITGHGEPRLQDAEGGLGRSEARLKSLGFLVDEVPLDVPSAEAAVANCPYLVVVAPNEAWPKGHVRSILERLRQGSRLFLGLSPTVNAKGELKDLGLQPLLEALGVRFINEFVLERDAARRLPEGMGEIFFAEAAPHAITRGLTGGGVGLDARPVVVASGALEVDDPTRAVSFLKTSPSALSLKSLDEPDEHHNGPFSLAVAFEGSLRPARGAAATVGPPTRAVVFAFENLITAGPTAEYSTRGNDLLLENSLLWLKGRDDLPSFRDDSLEAEPSQGLLLTEDSLSSLARYVLWELPAASLFLSLLVFWRRSRVRHERVEGSK